MRIINGKKIDSVILYGSSFLLLWQFIKPLDQIANTSNSHMFLLFIGISLLCNMISVPFILSAVPKLVIIVYFLNMLFYKQSFFDLHWIPLFLGDLKYNIGIMIGQQWWEMTNSFRTFLFFMLLWVFCYLITYWLTYTRKVFFFVLITIIYLSIIDTFLPFDAKWAMVQTVSIGCFLLIYIHGTNLLQERNVNGKRIILSLAIIAITSLAMLFAFSLPKFSPQWPDPIPYVQSAATKYQERVGIGGVSKIGYGTNDERLGGPFVGDDTTVFQATTSEAHYWRVETKDTYTGKGWVSSENPSFTQQYPNNIVLEAFDERVETTEKRAIISIVEEASSRHYIYAPELKQIQANGSVDVFINKNTEKISIDTQQNDMKTYGIVFEHAVFSIDTLRESEQASGAIQIEKYLQLPDNLPDRVGQLARDITDGSATQYDKVREVERFLSFGEYVYDTKEVAIPGEGMDYVDQFLFETKIGYCDNFSTSMVVLLRTLGIPSRWVKGYTQGTYSGPGEVTGTRVYDIKNENAHSWVEVYFPGHGWVPFEPTRSFTNPYRFATTTSTQPETQTQEEQKLQQQDEVEEQEIPEDEKGSSTTATITNLLKGTGVLICIFILFATIAFFTRKKWLLPLILYRIGRRKDPNAFSDAYKLLLNTMDKKVLPRQNGQTLREYAKIIDDALGMNDMEKLTTSYERVLYAGRSEEVEWGNSKELWENLIKKALS